MHSQAGWRMLEGAKDALSPLAPGGGFSLHSPAAMTAGPERTNLEHGTKSAGTPPELMCLLCGFAVGKTQKIGMWDQEKGRKRRGGEGKE